MVASASSLPVSPWFCSSSASSCCRSTLRARALILPVAAAAPFNGSTPLMSSDWSPLASLMFSSSMRECAVLNGRVAAWHGAPLDALSADRQLGQVDFLMVGMQDDAAGRVELARLFLGVGLELDALILVGGRRRQGVDLQPSHLDESGGRRGLDLGVLDGQIGNADRVLAVDVERFVVVVADVAAVHRPVVCSADALPVTVPSSTAAPAMPCCPTSFEISARSGSST